MHNLDLLLIAGAKEEDLCQQFNCTHLQLRTKAKQLNAPLNYLRIPLSLQQEIRNKRDSEDWPRKKLAARYFIRLDQVLACFYHTLAKPPQEFDEQEALNLANQGYSYKQLAKHFKTTTYQIKKVVHNINKHGLTPQEYQALIEQVLEHKTVKDIARYFNLSIQVVYRIRNSLIVIPERKAHTRVNTIKIKELYNQGLTQQEIAVKLNTTQPTVHRHLRKT